jgi:hypothetical protein
MTGRAALCAAFSTSGVQVACAAVCSHRKPQVNRLCRTLCSAVQRSVVPLCSSATPKGGGLRSTHTEQPETNP